MNLRRLLLAASSRDGVRGRMARRASDEGEFVRALGETDRLLRIAPPDAGTRAGDRVQAQRARQRIVRALEGVEPAAPAPPAQRWRPIAATAFAAAAAAAVVLTPMVVWRTASAPAQAPMAAAGESAGAGFNVGPEAAAAPRLSWTLVAGFDQPLRAEAAALAADVRRFGALVAPGVVAPAEDIR